MNSETGTGFCAWFKWGPQLSRSNHWSILKAYHEGVSKKQIWGAVDHHGGQKTTTKWWWWDWYAAAAGQVAALQLCLGLCGAQHKIPKNERGVGSQRWGVGLPFLKITRPRSQYKNLNNSYNFWKKLKNIYFDFWTKLRTLTKLSFDWSLLIESDMLS